MIHISGVEYSYFVTKNEYENYHLNAEFKWGDATSLTLQQTLAWDS